MLTPLKVHTGRGCRTVPAAFARGRSHEAGWLSSLSPAPLAALWPTYLDSHNPHVEDSFHPLDSLPTPFIQQASFFPDELSPPPGFGLMGGSRAYPWGPWGGGGSAPQAPKFFKGSLHSALQAPKILTQHKMPRSTKKKSVFLETLRGYQKIFPERGYP